MSNDQTSIFTLQLIPLGCHSDWKATDPTALVLEPVLLSIFERTEIHPIYLLKESRNSKAPNPARRRPHHLFPAPQASHQYCPSSVYRLEPGGLAFLPQHLDRGHRHPAPSGRKQYFHSDR